MDRTQIYLPKKQLNLLKKEALKRDTTVSYLVREAITKKYSAPVKPLKARRKTFREMAKEIEKLGAHGPKDLAENMDEYLYGGK